MKNKYSLTEEHKALIPQHVNFWIKNAMSTKQMDSEDRRIMIDSINGLYDAANKPRPKNIVFVASPFIARFAGGYAAAIWYLRKKYIATYEATIDATYDATNDATYDATNDATNDATIDATYEATRNATIDATYAATRNATYDATRNATYAATDEATYEATIDATYDATNDATRDATRAATIDATYEATYEDLSKWYYLKENQKEIAKKIGGKNYLFFLECTKKSLNLYQGGNFWSAYDSFLTFFMDIIKLKLPIYKKYIHWKNASIHGSYRIMHEDFCIISDRPCVLKVDERNRPHCEDGAYCKWRDGSALYAVHGVRVPAWIIETPEKITVEKIDLQNNAEIRRIMIQKYGQARYIQDSKAEEVHHDDWGTLYRKKLKDDEDILMVKYLDHSPEEYGEYKTYFHRVHPELRPMISQNDKTIKLGEPQLLTAKNAIASTFGLRGEEYNPVFQS